MSGYSIYVKRDGYSGSDPKKRLKTAEHNRDAAMLEQHVKDQFAQGRRGYYLFSEIGRAVDLSTERVRKVLRSERCGHNGVWLTEKIELENE